LSEITYLRWAVTAGLVYGTYTETGKFTAISFLLLFSAIEILVISIERRKTHEK